ncbi:MAG: NAD(P)/FAD-dependent oxidoreductase [Olsenella sp.]|jgi:glycerol-3-phosphate dehydrogenase|nr:NAD(P)/FAD-dependent oxidoreductase [Olsenella sp.]
MGDPTWDVVVVGAGVCGCAIARELSRLRASVLVVEAREDVCCGTSKANSAIVHAGFDAPTGSLMARLNVEGSSLFPQLSRDLDFAYERIGSLVVCTREEDLPALRALLERGRANGVPELSIVGRDELVRMEPNVSDAAVAALWAPTGGICDPFDLTCALAENAAANGVSFSLNERVTGLHGLPDDTWGVSTTRGTRVARVVVNAAGVHADEVHGMASTQPMRIVPRRGQYELLDTTAGCHVRHTVFALPTKMGKGVLVTPTVHGNLLVGPTAEDIEDKDGTQTTAEGLARVREASTLTVRDIPFRETITSFSGLRAHRPEHEFAIGEVPDAPGFVDCAGIESPGLSASPAIGRMVAGIVRDILGLSEREGFVATRRGIPRLDRISLEDWDELVRKDPAYGRVVCRCCRVSEAQIRDACRRVPGARSIDGVKRRVGATMGRCQGGFCTPRIMQILCEEVPDLDLLGVCKSGPGSELAVARDKDGIGGEAHEA